ncbi:MAG TPA: TonB-dependent receptor [Bryobacteraceae bacterium]|nr:TonB-dependent receptor [Bryobacteraceae bacterium]
MSKAFFPVGFVSLLLAITSSSVAQAPTGIISGTVTDDSGAVIPNASLTVTNKATGAARSISANAEGLFSAPALPSGVYEVRAEVQGFRTMLREAEVAAGSTTTVNMTMSLGATREVVTVEAATAQINYESHSVQGVIQRDNIQDLPLNGRSFLQLSTLEPGVVVTPATTSQFNALFSVSILGGATQRTLVTIDGGIVNDTMEGGTGMNFSQEVVQEFQLSAANFDLATNITGVGAVNVVSRSGGNDFHGSGYFFFRDHNMAAYPALKRNAFNPNPFFARRNPGFWVGGPIVKDRAFFFFNLETMNQTLAVTFQPDAPSAAPLAAIFSSPYVQKLLSNRFDYRLSTKHSLFARYSHDGNHSFGPNGSNEQSAWVRNTNWADQSIIGLTSALTPSLVNDVRFEYQYWHNTNYQALASDCAFPCVGGGLPSINSMVGFSTFQVGAYNNAPQQRTTRRYEYVDSLNWQKGSHRLKLGGDITREVNNGLWGYCLPLCVNVYSPETVRSTVPAASLGLFANLPASIRSNADILNLPVSLPVANGNNGIGIGDPTLPGPYNRPDERPNTRVHFYAQDTWKLRSNLTLNYGLGYEFESGLFNPTIPKPAYLAPILGSNHLTATQNNLLDFSPALGLAWNLDKSGKTVIRGGAGMYWDTVSFYQKWKEESYIGPVGNGRLLLNPSVLTNIFPGIVNFNAGGATLPIGAPLPLLNLTNLTFGQFLQIYNQQIGAIAQKLTPPVPTSGPFPVSGIDVAKQGLNLYASTYPLVRSYQTSIGIQRDLGHDMVLTADYARRLYVNVQLPSDPDLNHYNKIVGGVKSPVIPACTASQLYVPGVECSAGAINFWTSQGRSVYNALLVKLQKRLSHRYQFTASYAYQSNDAIVSLVNLDNYFQGYGDNLARHNLTVAGIVNLPWGFQLSVNSVYLSRTPAMATVPNIDLSGTAAVGSGPLPGIAYNCLNDGCNKSDLAKAVANFNSTYAGKKAPNGATIPSLILPPNYQFNDPTLSQDFRLTKAFTLKERFKFSVFGEMFNTFNIANLTGYSFLMNTVNPDPNKQTFSFGQPTQRATQVFGSGGPRALQIGGRFTF